MLIKYGKEKLVTKDVGHFKTLKSTMTMLTVFSATSLNLYHYRQQALLEQPPSDACKAAVFPWGPL